jgi:glycerate kinase
LFFLLKILVAPASYKGSIAAHSLAEAMALGCQDLLSGDMHRLYSDFQLMKAPIADGGDDTLSSLNQALGGTLVTQDVTGPTGQIVSAAYLKLAKNGTGLAIVELARASGIAYLQKSQLAPLTAHTYGTGQLINSAIAGGATEIVIAIGGSASTDGGTAALSAMGAMFLDQNGKAVPLGGGSLLQIARIDLSQLWRRIAGVRFIVATDVTSPLTGAEGAAAIFAPQKGASPADVALLDQGLAHFARLVQEMLMQRWPDQQLHYHKNDGQNEMEQSPRVQITPANNSFTEAENRPSDISRLPQMPGAGAAGGAGFGFAALLGAEIVSGFHYLAGLLDLEQKIAWCDLVIVAEGKLDKQSLTGKGVGEVIAMAARLGKGVLALPAISDLSVSELALIVGSLGGGKVVLEPTAPPHSAADLEHVRAATVRALAAYL